MQRVIKINLQGEIQIYSMDTRPNESPQRLSILNVDSILQVIHGRLSAKDKHKFTLVIDAQALKIHQYNEIEEDFYFNNTDELNKLVDIIQFIVDYKAQKEPKDERQELIEYRRRGYLFIIKQSTSSRKRPGRQMRDLRNHFRMTGIGAHNKVSDAGEIIESPII